MTNDFDYLHTVVDSEIDEQGHANNVVYVAWMQAAAVAHSDAQGWNAARYREVGHGWFVRRHTIEYLSPAVAGDPIVVETWVATMRRVSSLRRYRIRRTDDGTLLAKAETLWAFVDYESGRPKRVLPEVASAFELVPDEPSRS